MLVLGKKITPKLEFKDVCNYLGFYSKRKCSLWCPIGSIVISIAVWRITGKIIRTAIFDTYAQL